MQEIFQSAETFFDLHPRKIDLAAHFDGLIGPDPQRLGIALLPLATGIDAELARAKEAVVDDRFAGVVTQGDALLGFIEKLGRSQVVTLGVNRYVEGDDLRGCGPNFKRIKKLIRAARKFSISCR